MAIWQFDFGLLPASRFEGLALDGSIVLDEYFVSGLQKLDENKESENYWRGFDTKLYWSGLSEIFGDREEHWGSGVIFGKNRAAYAEVWDDEISIRVDVREVEPNILPKIVDYGQANHLLFVFAETGQLHAPKLSTLMNQIENSRAFRFSRFPASALILAER